MISFLTTQKEANEKKKRYLLLFDGEISVNLFDLNSQVFLSSPFH